MWVCHASCVLHFLAEGLHLVSIKFTKILHLTFIWGLFKISSFYRIIILEFVLAGWGTGLRPLVSKILKVIVFPYLLCGTFRVFVRRVCQVSMEVSYSVFNCA